MQTQPIDKSSPFVFNKPTWLDPKKSKPAELQLVAFYATKDFNLPPTIYEGVYIEKEDLFFIGFADSGDFFFSRSIHRWIPLIEFKNNW
jgi:hypothetical protein